MNTPRMNAEFNIGLPISIGEGYRNSAEAHLAVSVGLARRLGDALANVVAWFRRGSAMAELNRLDDRELADIGLSRSNLSRVFDENFAREHARRGY